MCPHNFAARVDWRKLLRKAYQKGRMGEICFADPVVMRKRPKNQGGAMGVPVPGDSGLGVFPPEGVCVEINKWRRIYDPHHEVIASHITVAYPPFIPEREWPLVRPVLVECLRAFQPFSITLKELGAFTGSPYVLWLQPEDSGNLSRIHVALVERFPNYVPVLPVGYIPHLTVGFFDSLEALSKAREAILSGIKGLRFQVDELIYMVLDDDGLWHIRDRLPLGQLAASA